MDASERASEGTGRVAEGRGVRPARVGQVVFFSFSFFLKPSYAFSWHGVTAHGFVAFSHSLIHPNLPQSIPSHPIHLKLLPLLFFCPSLHPLIFFPPGFVFFSKFFFFFLA